MSAREDIKASSARLALVGRSHAGLSILRLARLLGLAMDVASCTVIIGTVVTDCKFDSWASLACHCQSEGAARDFPAYIGLVRQGIACSGSLNKYCMLPLSVRGKVWHLNLLAFAAPLLDTLPQTGLMCTPCVTVHLAHCQEHATMMNSIFEYALSLPPHESRCYVQ